MHKRMVAVCVVFAILLTAVAACRTPAGRGPGRVIDDATITSKIKTKLLAEGILQGLAINVETFKGEVTLIGAVDTPEQRAKAEQIARDTEGVTKVNDLLQLRAH